jgi:hypothetical protein
MNGANIVSFFEPIEQELQLASRPKKASRFCTTWPNNNLVTSAIFHSLKQVAFSLLFSVSPKGLAMVCKTLFLTLGTFPQTLLENARTAKIFVLPFTFSAKFVAYI